MAQRLKDYKPVVRKGPPRKYDTTQWFVDGDDWVRLVKGEDFDCEAESLAQLLRRYAKEDGKKIEIRTEDENTLVIRTSPLDGSIRKKRKKKAKKKKAKQRLESNGA